MSKPTLARLPAAVLIANRGEIAIRIARTCRDLGIRSIAVYSTADHDSPHVRACDEAVQLTGERPRDGYLDGDQIVEVARARGAAAIHPGYGFLSENAGFARTCRDAGLVFVGPNPDVIATMGDKIAAKDIAAKAGVPVVPGFVDTDDSQDRDAKLRAAATDMTFPLLLKASAGGGGRGMRIVKSPDQLDGAIEAARREASAAFGSDRLLVERYITSPRHIEVQVFGDQHGNIVHLHERDCSVQRRHQKLIEEAPAARLQPETRAALHAAALSLASATGYDNAGTVEFVLDADTEEFFFLEVNTRLQVEHPVTEAIFGVDLVDWQIRVAAGQPLPVTQEDIEPNGWAIEARIVSEDPARNFIPQTGHVAAIFEPSGAGIRFDSGIAAGHEVTPHYDSMLAKVIAWGADRETAINRLDHSLASASIMGLKTSMSFTREMMRNPTFLAAEHTTHLLDRFKPEKPPAITEMRNIAAAALALMQHTGGDRGRGSPWQSLGAWRGGFSSSWQARTPLVLSDEKQNRHTWWMSLKHDHIRLNVMSGSTEEKEYRASFRSSGNRIALVDDEGASSYLTHVEMLSGKHRVHVDAGIGSRRYDLLEGLSAWTRAEGKRISAGADVLAPGPGVVVAIGIEAGAKVKSGDEVLTIESMKMQHKLTAAVDGTVKSINCSPGQPMAKGDLLVEIEPNKTAKEP